MKFELNYIFYISNSSKDKPRKSRIEVLAAINEERIARLEDRNSLQLLEAMESMENDFETKTARPIFDTFVGEEEVALEGLILLWCILFRCCLRGAFIVRFKF